MKQPQVGIIMGSDSDLPVMREAVIILEELKVPCETTIVSAHRTPDRMFRYAREAKDRGLKVIIAGAGGAAHLPGMTASITSLPVIGVPVKSRNLQGLDSLLSIVQMPPGIPVATMAVNGARNAGLMAARILALQNMELSERLEEWITQQRDQVLDKVQALEEVGMDMYLEGRNHHG